MATSAGQHLQLSVHDGVCERGCWAMYVDLPADLVARRFYALPVIRTALIAAAGGAGSGAVAAQLRALAGTVRSWLRRAAATPNQLDRFSVQTVVALDGPHHRHIATAIAAVSAL